MIDRVTKFESWKSIEGKKTVSLEELLMLDDGTGNYLPQTLVLESCIELARMLINRSSDFTISSILSEAEEFSFPSRVGAGEVMKISAEITGRDDETASFKCRISLSEKEAVSGQITVSLIPLKELSEHKQIKIMWEEVCNNQPYLRR